MRKETILINDEIQNEIDSYGAYKYYYYSIENTLCTM